MKFHSPKKFYLSGWIYHHSIDWLLLNTRRQVACYISSHNLFPALDICCGTGSLCSLIRKNHQLMVGLDLDLRMVTYASHKYPHLIFLCADSSCIPFKEKSMKGIIISYSLHDKSPQERLKMIEQVRWLLAPDGQMILVDFENPWNRRSQVGAIFTLLIEKMAGKEHFRNGRQFLKQGGLKYFLQHHDLVEIERYPMELASSSLVVASFA